VLQEGFFRGTLSENARLNRIPLSLSNRLFFANGVFVFPSMIRVVLCARCCWYSLTLGIASFFLVLRPPLVFFLPLLLLFELVFALLYFRGAVSRGTKAVPVRGPPVFFLCVSSSSSLSFSLLVVPTSLQLAWWLFFRGAWFSKSHLRRNFFPLSCFDPCT